VLQQVSVPTDVGEALAYLARDPAAMLLAGGTLLMPAVNTETTGITSLISTRRLGLDDIDVDGDRATIGAAVTLADVGTAGQLAFLTPVTDSIASPPIRNLATVGGNLFAWQPYGDFAVALLALDAVVRIAGDGGLRQAPVAEVLEGGVAPGELVTAVQCTIPEPGTWFYTKAMRRRLNSAAIVTVAAVVSQSDGAVSTARIALGGAGPRPLRARSVEAVLLGKPLDPASVAAAAERAVDDAAPFSDAYASAWYRARVLPVHIRRAILGE
jgi:CO/xanthine dehydrogenase FAD-binding subunit